MLKRNGCKIVSPLFGLKSVQIKQKNNIFYTPIIRTLKRYELNSIINEVIKILIVKIIVRFQLVTNFHKIDISINKENRNLFITKNYKYYNRISNMIDHMYAALINSIINHTFQGNIL
jgi:hypothetical protein